jgi:hypothetical protein
MRNIILQHFTGKLRTLDKLSVENISAYAERIGVEYQFVEGQVFREHLTPPCQKVDEKWDEYDDVLMLDIDMFVTKNLRLNVFKAEGVGLFADVQKRLKNRLVQHGRIESESAYFGGAIYKLTKQQRQSLRDGIPEDNSWMDPYNEAYQFEDEGIMSELFHRTDTQWSNLDQKWCQDSYMPEHKAGMIHVRTKIKPEGPKREKIDNFYDLQMRGVI